MDSRGIASEPIKTVPDIFSASEQRDAIRSLTENIDAQRRKLEYDARKAASAKLQADRKKGIRTKRITRASNNPELRKAITELHAGVPKALSAILLPHQMKRLEQLLFQAEVRSAPLRSPIVARAIGLPEKEHKQLIVKLDAEAKRAAEQRESAWIGTLQRCIEALPDEQEAAYHRLIGEAFPPP